SVCGCPATEGPVFPSGAVCSLRMIRRREEGWAEVSLETRESRDVVCVRAGKREDVRDCSTYLRGRPYVNQVDNFALDTNVRDQAHKRWAHSEAALISHSNTNDVFTSDRQRGPVSPSLLVVLFVHTALSLFLCIQSTSGGKHMREPGNTRRAALLDCLEPSIVLRSDSALSHFNFSEVRGTAPVFISTCGGEPWAGAPTGRNRLPFLQRTGM
ncbi:hypothetical protein KUCAC02_004871, partial [Chaenocephalus aceratus]